MKFHKIGLVYFSDGHTEEILRAEAYPGVFGLDWVDFETVSGKYRYEANVDVFSNGFKHQTHAFYDINAMDYTDAIVSIGLYPKMLNV